MSASTCSQAICPICKEEIENSCHNWVAVRSKGAKGINESSVKRKDNLVVAAGDKVHISCRQRYINEKDIQSHVATESSSSVPGKKITRQSSGCFASEADCIFCGCTIE